MPGTVLTPEVVLARTLEKAPRIKAVAVMILWDDDTVDADWSQMKVSDLCFLDRSFGHELDTVMRGGAE